MQLALLNPFAKHCKISTSKSGLRYAFELCSTRHHLLIFAQQTVKYPVPVSALKYVIGRAGATVKDIQQKTGARINLPKVDQPSAPADDDDDLTVDVTIEGDSMSAGTARKLIEDIVNQHSSTSTTRLRDIPPEYFPFIAGASNARIAALEGERDLRVHVPSYYMWEGQPPPQQPEGPGFPVFQPSPKHHIQLSGERRAVQEARAEIERQVTELQRQITLSQLDINRRQHQFVIGERGVPLQDFFAETGCSVILPHDSEDTETITVVGPADRIDEGINKVMELATSMQLTNVDPAKLHANAPQGAQAHARNLTRYLQHRKEIERLEKLHNAHIALPIGPNDPTAWEIYSREGKSGLQARNEITNIIKGHPPTRMANVEVDPFFHTHVRRQSLPHVRQNYGIHMVFPEECEETPEILLVFEGPSGLTPEYQVPKSAPTAADVAQFQRALEQAREYILNSVVGHEEVVSKNIEVPNK
jgi:hypothetical protein